MSPNQPPPLSSFLHIFPTMRNSTQYNESLNIIHVRTEVQVRGTKHAHMLIFNQFATPIEQKQAVKAYDGLMNSKVGRFGQLCVLKFNEIEKNHRKIRKKNKGGWILVLKGGAAKSQPNLSNLQSRNYTIHRIRYWIGK